MQLEECVGAALALLLQRPRGSYLARDVGAAFAAGPIVEHRGFARYRQVQVDPVEQWAGQLVAVALDLFRAAATAAGRVAQIAAGTWIHRRDQLEACWEANPVLGACDHDLARLQRLSQHLEDPPLELWQFVKEQHAMVGESDLARLRAAATANQRRSRGGVMGVTEGSLRPAAQWRLAADRLDRRDFQRLVFVQRRQQAGQTAGEQGLAGSWWPGEQQVVRARRSHQQGPLGRDLALYLAEVGIWPALAEQTIGRIRRQGHLAIEVRYQGLEVVDCIYHQAAGQAGFFGVLARHHQGAPGLARRQGRRQYPLLV